jgi:hypothetical protein
MLKRIAAIKLGKNYVFQLLGITDPLVPLENLFKKIFLGGIFDTLQKKLFTANQKRKAQKLLVRKPSI